MGTMTKLRDRAGAIMIVILAFAFGGLWMLQDTGVFSAMGSGQRPGNIIVVNGDPVSSEEFGRTVEQEVRRLEQRTSQPATQQARDRASNRAFERLVNQRLREHEMDRLGITVTDDELYTMVMGPKPHPMMLQIIRSSPNLAKSLLSENGQINRQALQQLSQNPQYKEFWIQIEDLLRSQRRLEKLNKLLGATVHASTEDVEDYHRRQNLTVDTRYVSLPYAEVPNDAISYTDDDLRAYYNEHKEDYRREKTYRVQYVTREKAATKADTTAIASDLDNMRSDFAHTENDSLFLARNASEQSYSSAYRAPTSLNATIADAIFPTPSQGRIVGPIYTGGQAHLVKITGVKPTSKTYVHARHILFRGEGQKQRQQARKIKERLTTSDVSFAEMARKHSDDGTASKGGDLGWFGPDQMAEPFTEAAFNAQPGEVIGPVKTQFGYHLIKVEGRAEQKIQIADLALPLRPTNATLSEIEGNMTDVSVFASEEGNFKAQAQRKNLDIQTAEVTTEDLTIPNLGPSRGVETFLEGAETGAVSEVVELDDRFAVLHVEGVTPEGYRPFEDVRPELEARVIRQKKQAVQQRKLEQALRQAEGNLDQLAQAVGASVQSKSGVSFSTSSVSGLGDEPAFVGTALGLKEGGTSGVITGENAVFVVSATQVNEPPPLTDGKRKQLRQQLLRQRRFQIQQQWMQALRESAEIEDNREQYS